MQFHAFRAESARTPPDDRFSESRSRRGQGNIDVVVYGFALCLALLRSLLHGTRFLHDADDFIINGLDPNRADKGVLIGE